MKHPIKLLVAGLVLLAGTGVARADAAYHDVVRDSNGKPVHAVSGDCVRTRSLVPTENCADAVATAAIALEDRTVYFGFKQAHLTGQAKRKLSMLAEMLKADGVKSVHVVGFADRLGKASSNDKLGVRRAAAVAAFLGSKGVTASVAETRGTESKTNCKKGLKRADLIKCLAKDRRVEVEVDGAAPEAPAAE